MVERRLPILGLSSQRWPISYRSRTRYVSSGGRFVNKRSDNNVRGRFCCYSRLMSPAVSGRFSAVFCFENKLQELAGNWPVKQLNASFIQQSNYFRIFDKY